MYTLYGFKRSGSAAVEAALERVGAEYRRVDAASWEEDSALDELAAANPLKQIPTLRLPDGSVMTESAAILIHLGLVHPEAQLLPADAAARAQSLRGLVYIAANCYSAIGLDDYPDRYYANPDDATDARIRQGARARLHGCWDVFADQFPAQPFLAGAVPGALDVLASVVTRWSGARDHLRSARPEFLAALLRIDSHPSLVPAFQRHWPA